MFKRTAKPTRVAIDELQLQDLQNMEAEAPCQLSMDTTKMIAVIFTCSACKAERQTAET